MICLKPSSWLASQKVDKNVQLHGRSPYGERGLKLVDHTDDNGQCCRSPYGERGLKFVLSREVVADNPSLSLRRAWIEIAKGAYGGITNEVALLTESVD